MESFIFTEAFNCAKVLKIALKSFHSHHDRKVHIFGNQKDFEELDEIKDHCNNVFVSTPMDLSLNYLRGHEGTAMIFAQVLSGRFPACDHIIHFDSDVYFKRESISLIEDGFKVGYDIIGSRRCYGNNPANVPNLHSYPDTISTYFFGINKTKIPAFEFDYFIKMCQGVVHPLNYPVLDFFDPITHVALVNKAALLYIDWNIIGSQNDLGMKNNNFKSNLHMDVGSHIIHFGGVGSGFAFLNKRSNPPAGYAQWAIGRYSLFAKLFYNEDINYREPTAYSADGRWVNGNYDDEIMNSLLSEMV